MLTIVGLGCSADDLSQGAKAAICSGARVILRTGETPAAQSVRELGVPFETLDALYAGCRSFDTLNKKLARAVLSAAREGETVYCVDGSVADDVSAQLVLRREKGARIFAGVSKADSAFAAARADASSRTALSAYSLPEERPVLPLCVYDVDCDLIAGDVKLWLCDRFGDEAEAFFVRGGKAKKIALFEADRQGEYDASSCIVVPAIPLLKRTRFNYDDLLAIMRLLRAPNGCPWDRAQTHESIRSNMVEEAYELVDAIDCKDDEKICEETGDVLMQGAFHSVLAQERGAFSPGDVLSGVCSKLIFRHSHIFGEDKAESEAGALSVWDKNKSIEKGQKTASDSVRDVPKVFPAAMRAQKAAKRAAKYGYDFKDAAEAAEKVKEELAELLAAIGEGDKAHIREEAGDLLFSAVNVGRLAGADCEECLQESTQKFIDRFCETERLILADGKKMNELSAEELWTYYGRAKDALHRSGR